MQNAENPQRNDTPSSLDAGQQPVMPSNEYEIEDWKWLVERDVMNEMGVPPRWETPEKKIEFHRRQLALLEKADDSPRCVHVFADGRMCKAPRVKRGTLCYAHAQMEARSPKQMNLPPLEDANAVMIWIMEVSRSLLDGRISERTAGLMFYGLQLAMATAKHTTFKDTDPLEMVRTAPPICRELKAQKRTEARMVTEIEVVDEPAETLLAEKSEAEDDCVLEEETGNAGVESAKSIFSGVEVDGGRETERGPSTSLRISPAGSDARIPAQVESCKSIFSGVELDGGRETERGPSTSLRISPAGSDARIPAQVEVDGGGTSAESGVRIPDSITGNAGGGYRPAGKPGVMLVHSGG